MLGRFCNLNIHVHSLYDEVAFCFICFTKHLYIISIRSLVPVMSPESCSQVVCVWGGGGGGGGDTAQLRRASNY